MSYSFSIRAANKEAAKALVAAELDKVCLAQDVHHRDRIQAYAAAVSFIDLLPDADKDIVVAMHGSISCGWDGSRPQDTLGVSVSVGANHVPRGA